MKKIILILIVIAAIASGCEKYTINKIYGEYILTDLKVDGVDELDQYYDSLSKRFYFHYEGISSYLDVCNMSGYRKDGGGSALVWTWELTEHNKILKINSSGTNPRGWSYGPFKSGYCPEWEILRLTYKKLKMKTTYNNKEYIIELEGN